MRKRMRRMKGRSRSGNILMKVLSYEIATEKKNPCFIGK